MEFFSEVQKFWSVKTKGHGSSLSACLYSSSVHLGQFTDQEYKEIMDYSFSTNIKYSVRFRSTSIRGCVSILLSFLRNVYEQLSIAL